MTPNGMYDELRKNFVKKGMLEFQFLMGYDYMAPEHKIRSQKDGIITRDELIFEKMDETMYISVSNSYHPIDYGFELNVYSRKASLKHYTREMIYHRMREAQDEDQSYLKAAAEMLKKYLDDRKGK